MTSLAAARLAPPGTLDPGTPAWATRASASKVAVMLGQSPFGSPFSLWHQMKGGIPWEVDNDTLRRGHYLEPAMRQWWRDQHPEYRVERTGTWVRQYRRWQIASPDGLVIDPTTGDVVGAVECKTSNNDWEWGTPGTDEVPRYYRLQGLWIMDTLGVPTVWFSVLTSYMNFVEYRVDYDTKEAAAIRRDVAAFMRSVRDGHPPALDDHDATYQAVRHLHPDIDAASIDLPADLAYAYVHAQADHATAVNEKRRQTIAVADAMGTARTAKHNGITIATRSSRAGAAPHLTAGRACAQLLLTKEAS